MKKLIFILVLNTIFFMNISAQDTNNGKALFEANGCAVCHKPDMDAMGPSLRTIANAYAGREVDMLSYLKGDRAPIVDPARASIMEPQLVKLRTMFEEDLHAISTYLIDSNR